MDVECRACNDSAADELRRCVRQMAQDGLDIDDATTAPVWTGKVTIDGVTHDVAEVVAERDRMRARVAELEAALEKIAVGRSDVFPTQLANDFELREFARAALEVKP